MFYTKLKREIKANYVELVVILTCTLSFLLGHVTENHYIFADFDTYMKSYNDFIHNWEVFNASIYARLNLLDLCVLIVLLRYSRTAFMFWLWYALFGFKDTFMYFINGNVLTVDESTMIYFTGVFFLSIYFLTKPKKR